MIVSLHLIQNSMLNSRLVPVVPVKDDCTLSSYVHSCLGPSRTHVQCYSGHWRDSKIVSGSLLMRNHPWEGF